jgi:hypothetical protein
MNTRQPILLSPYRLPTHNTMYLGDEEVSAFLNGYAALWHPAALHGAAAPPRVASPYDQEQPTAGCLFAVPDNPPLLLPDDWEERVRTAGARLFHCTADRDQTLRNLLDALRPPIEGDPDAGPLLDLPAERVAPFFGIGFGGLVLEGLFEAMSHDNVLSGSDFMQDITAAVAALADPDPEATRRHLQSAADRLLAAREVLYPVTIHLVDLALPDEEHLGAPWPASLDRGQPLNVIACASLLERLGREHPEKLAVLRERVAADGAEVCGGSYLEREDPLLPVESQLWNLARGVAVTREVAGQEVRVFARRRFGFHPQLPLWLHNVGISRALLVAFDEAVLPAHRSLVVSWPSPDGKQVEAFTRTPHAADSAQTYFHLAYHLHQTIMQDQAATLALLHREKPDPPFYADWLELSRFAPVLGRFTTLSGFFNEVLPGDYTAAASADEFHGDYLVERVGDGEWGMGNASQAQSATAFDPSSQSPFSIPHSPFPIGAFARQVRLRRRLDTCLTLAALYRSLARTDALPDLGARLDRLEDALESGNAKAADEVGEVLAEVGDALARRLVARGAEGQPGMLVLNPCSFKRRVVLELPGAGPVPLGGPVKATQAEGDTARVVAEVPALGFAWFPRGSAGRAAGAGRMRLADERCVRNEFFEAEVDPQTGGLRAIRDQRTRIGRLGQQLVFNPGSTMRVKQIRTTSTGPALGEIVSEGALLDPQDQVLATFRQRFRAWLGRPVLDLRLEVFPARPPEGYPWHAYYAARFAWRDERATLLRGVNGSAAVTSQSRPETPDFLEVRLGRNNVVLFPGGLPFHQRHGGRMLDVLLVCPGETTQVFDLAIGLDRDFPMQTALGLVTPAPAVVVDRGPPHVGAEGWLFHLDAPNLLLTSLRPAPDGADGVLARLLECGGHGGAADFRCVRDPVRASLLDARGTVLTGAATRGDAVALEVAPNDLVSLRVDFS